MVETCQILTSTANTGINGNGRTLSRLGVRFDLGHAVVGSVLSNISFYLRRYPGTQSDYDISVKQYSASGTLGETSDTIAATLVSTSAIGKHTFTFSPEPTVSAGDMFMVETSTFPLSEGNELLVVGCESCSQEYSDNTYYKYNTNTSAFSSLAGSCQVCWDGSASPSTGTTVMPPPIAPVYI